MSTSIRNQAGFASRRRVLLVDDDVVSQEVVSALLGQDGHQVSRVDDGESALQMLANSGPSDAPEVLLVDMQMPGLSGSELAERIRALKGSEPLLLAMSASRIQTRQLEDFDGFLLKPFALDDLRKAFASARRDRPAPSFTAPLQERSKTDHLDRRVLAKLHGMMPEKALRELYEVYLTDTRIRASAMKKQAAAKDLTELRRGAHQIKGAAAMLGATRIAGLAEILEQGGSKEADTPRLVDDLLAACVELERILFAGELQNSNDYNTN